MFIGPSVICLLCTPTHLLLLVHSTLQDVNTVCNGEIGLYGSAMNSGSKLLSPAAMDNASHCVVLSSRERFKSLSEHTLSHTHTSNRGSVLTLVKLLFKSEVNLFIYHKKNFFLSENCFPQFVSNLDKTFNSRNSQ